MQIPLKVQNSYPRRKGKQVRIRKANASIMFNYLQFVKLKKNYMNLCSLKKGVV
jgi:hypothetical protein